MRAARQPPPTARAPSSWRLRPPRRSARAAPRWRRRRHWSGSETGCAQKCGTCWRWAGMAAVSGLLEGCSVARHLGWGLAGCVHCCGAGWMDPHAATPAARQPHPASRPTCAGEAEVAAALAPRMTATAPLEPKPAPAAAQRTSRGAISLIKAADGRILALEGDVRRREAEAAALQAQLVQAQVGCRVRRGGGGAVGCLPLVAHTRGTQPGAGRAYCCCCTPSRPCTRQEALARRDAEIARLGAAAAAGPDVDGLAQRARNDANEAVILQLNQQVRVGGCGPGVRSGARWLPTAAAGRASQPRSLLPCTAAPPLTLPGGGPDG